VLSGTLSLYTTTIRRGRRLFEIRRLLKVLR